MKKSLREAVFVLQSHYHRESLWVGLQTVPGYSLDSQLNGLWVPPSFTAWISFIIDSKLHWNDKRNLSYYLRIHTHKTQANHCF